MNIVVKILCTAVVSGVLGVWPLTAGSEDSGRGTPSNEMLTASLAEWKEVVGQVNPSLSQTEVERILRSSVRWSRAHGLAPELVLAIIWVESHFRPHAVSHQGAVGLMQVVPAWHDPREGSNLRDPDTNIATGCAILRQYIRRYDDLNRGLAAYYAGPQRTELGMDYAHKVMNHRERLNGAE
jgi:soluble lytic murein transglycosylase-like protein